MVQTLDYPSQVQLATVQVIWSRYFALETMPWVSIPERPLGSTAFQTCFPVSAAPVGIVWFAPGLVFSLLLVIVKGYSAILLVFGGVFQSVSQCVFVGMISGYA